jgi:transposase
MTDVADKPTFGSPPPPATPKARFRSLNRAQSRVIFIDVERLIPDDHPARAIWELVGRMDLSRFCEKVKVVEGRAGQPPFDPRLMISIWAYGLSQGISSARRLSELCDWEPGLQWLGAMGSVNYHSLSTFRVAHGEALKQLCVELLGVLSAQGLVGMERVAVDGTRIVASCGEDSLRKGKGLEEHLQKAAEQVEALEQESPAEGSRRQEAARERSRRERKERVAAAQQQLEKLQKERGVSEAAKVQVSKTEPEARVMKQPGGWRFCAWVQSATGDRRETEDHCGWGVERLWSRYATVGHGDGGSPKDQRWDAPTGVGGWGLRERREPRQNGGARGGVGGTSSRCGVDGEQASAAAGSE